MFSELAHRVFSSRACFLGAAVLAAGTALHGCGGGGGGGDGGGGGPSYSLSHTSVSFSANQGDPIPPAQVVTLTVNSGTVYIDTQQSGSSNFSHSFSLTGPTSGQITITPGFTSNAGAFTGTISVHGCSDPFCGSEVAGSPQTIAVTYTVTGFSVAPTALEFASMSGQTPAPQDVTLSLIPGGSAFWIASVNYGLGTGNWLALAPASSGTLNPSQTVSLGVNAPPAAEEVRTATVTFTAGSIAKSVAVTYAISDPGVKFIAPYIATTGAGGSVVLRGHGFSSLNAPTTTVQFGASTPSAATVVSDTEMRTTYPPLAAGSHSVTVSDGGPVLATRSGVKLFVAEPLPFPPAAADIARANGAQGADSLVYDAERRALYLMDQRANRLERYLFNGIAWPDTTIQFAGGGSANRRIALSPDGTLLLRSGSDTTVLTRIDAASFAPLPGDDAAAIGTNGLGRITFANDGTALGTSSGNATLYRYDMLTRQFFPLGTNLNFTNRQIAAAADGDTLVLTSPIASSGIDILTYDATTRALTQRAARNATDIDNHEKASVSRDGSRVMVMGPDPGGGLARPALYDASFALLGRLPGGANNFVLKPDGSSAYAYYPAGSSVRKFDLTAPLVSGNFPEIGAGTAITSPGNSAFAIMMTISLDGTALFLAGTERVIVMPAP